MERPLEYKTVRLNSVDYLIVELYSVPDEETLNRIRKNYEKKFGDKVVVVSLGDRSSYDN